MENQISPVHLIQEMRHDVKTRDVKKAALVLSYLNRVDDETQLAILEELSRAAPDFALPLLGSVIAENPMMEMAFPEIRQWMGELAASSPEDFKRAIFEAKGMLRAVLAGTAAEIGMEEAENVLLEVLNQERNLDVLCAVLDALGEVGSDEAAVNIAEFLYADDDDLFAAAARALSRIGSPQAVDQLRRRIGIHPHIDEIIVGILWEVQTPDSLRAINSVLSSSRAAVRGAAKQALRITGVKSIPILIENLTGSDNDVLVLTLELLGDIGDDSAYRPIRHLLQRHPENPNVRFAAYEAMGKLPMQGKGFALAAGLEDPVESVRTAAAGAIEKNLDASLAAGIRNLVEGGGKNLEAVVRAAAEARAVALGASLSENDEKFRTAFVDYLTSRAHPETRSFFAASLTARGQAALAGMIAGEAEAAPKARKRVFAVDDSQMILRIYKGVLHQLGFEPVTYESPLEAVEAALTSPPDAILTDLNMPEITGVELIKRVRGTFGKGKLPIVMVTTQEAGEDFKDAYDAGVDKVIHKPFNAATISEVLAQVGINP